MKKLLFSLFLLSSIGLIAQNLDSGLVVHYQFDRTIEDSSQDSNHLTGTFVNNYIPFYQFDSAYYFDGNARLYQVNNFNNSGFTSTSVSMWVKPEIGPTNVSTIIQAAYAGFAINLDNVSGKIGAFFSSSSASILNSTINLLDSNWHHVVALNTGTETKIYIDGVFNASRSQTLVTSGGAANLKRILLGATNLYLNLYKGGLNDVRVYNRVLTQSEITILSTFPTATGISQNPIEKDLEVTIFPNPTTGNIQVRTNDIPVGSILSVKNMLGQVVEKHTLIKDPILSIDLNGENGIYFLEIISPSNNKVVKKIIKF